MKPMEYQHAGVEYGLQRNHHLFGDAPGLGKTAECILLGNAIEAKHTLVVCPASLRLNWEREIWSWSTIPNVSTYPVLKSGDGVSLDANYVIISYALLANQSILDAILDVTWDHVILDEAHAIKDPKGNTRTRAICAPDCIPSVAGRITLASGTLLPNQPIECLGQNTMVLTHRGWLPILRVSDDDLLWDGVEWVQHEGVAFKGWRQTGVWAGVEMTPDHQVLVGESWCSAERLGDVDTLRQALETGSGGSLLSEWTKAARAVFSACGSPVTVGSARPTEPTKRIYEGASTVADLAALEKGSNPVSGTMKRSALTRGTSSGCLAASATSISDVITRRFPVSIPTAAEASVYGRLGGRIADAFSRIWSRFLDGMTRRWSLTGSTSTKDTSQGICDGSRVERTPETGARFVGSNPVSTSLRPVYDLVNAGPRQRFTILSSAGPLIVHNCYNAVRLLNWGAIDRMSLEAFREHYYDLGGGMVRGPVFDPVTQSWSNKLHWSEKVRNVPRNLDELQRRLRQHIMVRRLKEQVLHELPPKQWHTFPLEVTSEMRRALKHPGWAIASKLYEMDADAFNDGIPVDGAISTARKMLGEAKMPSVAAYIEDLLEGGVDKLVVTAWHTSVLHYLRDKLSKYGLVYMDGSTSAAKKQLAVDQFQSQDKIKIILGQTAVIGEGWTLTQAQDVVLAEPDWVPGRNDQALDRIHRKGQTGDRVIGHIPVVPGTLDERVMSTAIRKDVSIYQALDHKHSI